jgi:DNA-binding GntR family transcriptional regulator
MASTPIDIAPVAGPELGRTGRSRADYVYETVHGWIQTRQIKVGDRVREEAVAQALSVSRTPVREALSRLQTQGLLQVSAGGLVVVELTSQQTMELYALREVLEGAAARAAAQHASANEISALYQLNAEFRDAIGDADKQAMVNKEFHQTIYDASRNRYITRSLADLHDTLMLLSSTTFVVPGRAAKAVGEHKRMIEAIEQRDADAAEQLAREHIRRAQDARFAMRARTS